ncbi:hypothetical protein [Paraburkholderia sp. UYCP14C]|uniref:hypothetical protein n=1 Tax=Paraburkholderia sp. UYCP14C TaxID=2511130 RepID=UPI0020071BF3|nr:hypothetical protein [Paraburkholderia sp. UYCP14C]
MQFSYTTNGDADGSLNAYGNNEISVAEDVLTVQIGDSDDLRYMSGVGIFELKLLNQNLEDARKLAELLCSPKDPASDVPILDLYIARCNGETRSSFVKDFSRDVERKIHALMSKLKEAAIRDGRKLVKLDLALVSVDRDKDGFVVSFRFINGGDYPIKFKTPDKWDTRMGKYMDILGVNGYRLGDSDQDQFGLALAGTNLVDPAQFPDGEVNLPAHSDVVIKMKTSSVSKFAAGTYDLNIGAFMNMEVVGIQSSLVRVDFNSNHKNPTRVTFDRDYPWTPEEREQWEVTQRARMSYFPVKPGETFAEEGLYRAVTLISGVRYRSLQVKRFKVGDVAARDKVKMLMENGNGINISGPVQWEWQATAPTSVKQYSFDIIDDTRQFCTPGSICPRSGRWVARVDVGSDFRYPEYQHDLSSLVRRRRGQPMPSIRAESDRADWEWVGPETEERGCILHA